ncbi:hypothetical protein GGH91_000653 [Coemansia sp. RSA 2671]|nr:hypothetical protein LPJ60_004743 [Coemansia sp. RSA 2675]KAJ2349691.1 hypothetical protein GGH91_000653 [Coemansia sp. RSA 2671]
MPAVHETTQDAHIDDDVRAAIADITAHAADGGRDDEEEDVSLLFEPLMRAEVHNCVFSSWYPNFRRQTIKSEIIKPLAPEFIDYLLADGIMLPDQDDVPEYSCKIEDPDSSDGEWSADENDQHDASAFTDIASTSADIRRRIEILGGKVMPRMCWSAPKDASWMAMGNSLECRNPSDIYVLLKSSDKISGDLINGRYLPKEQLGDIEHELVLRQWSNLVPSMEFRCFVKNKRLVAVSQIDYEYYEFLENMRDEILTKLGLFFDEHVREKFPSENYCYDAYVAQTVDRVYLIDFEPWTPSVDSCLFEWSELVKADSSGSGLGLRLFPKGVSAMGHFSGKYSKNRFPVEATDEQFRGSMTELIKSVAEQTRQQQK